MTEVAPDVWLLDGIPPQIINVYLVGDVLLDGGSRFDRYHILRQLRGRSLSMVALTHCHPDHQGAVRAVCQRWDVPLACHEADADAMEGRTRMAPYFALAQMVIRCTAGPPHPVAIRWRGGEEVAGFRVIHAPGHTPGHVVLFRESDGVAIVGDVLNNLGPLRMGSLWPGLREPPGIFSVDPEENRRSIALVHSLRPRMLCFGHGPPLRDMSQLDSFMERKGI